MAPTPQRSRARPRPRPGFVPAASTGCALALLAGCALEPAASVAEAPDSPVRASDTARAAYVVKKSEPGRASGPGRGESMQPLMGRNSYVVIDPIAYEALRPGMLVAYRNLAGQQVVHRLVEKEGGYWTVEGINNQFADADYVTPDNLIGVVYGTFHSAR